MIQRLVYTKVLLSGDTFDLSVLIKAAAVSFAALCKTQSLSVAGFTHVLGVDANGSITFTAMAKAFPNTYQSAGDAREALGPRIVMTPTT